MAEITLIGQLNSRSFYDTEQGITRNLSSLQFDAGISDSEKGLLFLRKRSYIQTINIVSHAVYFTSMLKEVKRRAYLTLNTESEQRFKVGVIGFGRIGSHLVKSLLERCKINEEDLKVSTRSAESTWKDFILKDFYFCTNREAAEDVDILFLCCSPHEVEKVLYEIKRDVNCLVYSIVAGLSNKKIYNLIKSKQIMKPRYENYLKEEYKDSSQWDFTKAICDQIALNDIKEMTCPLQNRDNRPETYLQNIVEINESYVHCLFLAALNICFESFMDMREAVALCNLVIFREKEFGFTFDSINQIKETSLYEGNKFQVSDFNEEHKAMMELKKSSLFYEQFLRNYRAVFDRFNEWTTTF